MVPLRRSVIALLAVGAATFAWWPLLPMVPAVSPSPAPAASAAPVAPAAPKEAQAAVSPAAPRPVDPATARRLVELQCRRGAELEGVRAFGAALAVYNEVLQSPPPEIDVGCAANGRARALVAQEGALEAVREGQRFAQAGRLHSAAEQYRRALRAEPGQPLALQELAALEVELAGARRAVAFGRYWKARADLAAASTGHAPVELPPDLEFLASTDRIVLRYLQDFRSQWVSLVEAALALLLLLALATRRGTLQIAPFTGQAAAIADGAELVALVGQELQSLAESRPGTLHLVRAPLDEIPVPAEITKLAPTWGSIADAVISVVKWLFPRRITTVTGVVQERSDTGTSVTLTLAEGNRIRASGTVWEKDFRPVGAQPRTGAARRVLAQAIATWIVFALNRKRRLLGTASWKSYALFRASMETKDPWAQRDLLAEALALDVNNRGARLAVGAWLVDRGENDAADRELRATILRAMRDSPYAFLTADTVWYSALYRWAQARFASGKFTEALAVAETLVAVLEAMRIDGQIRQVWGSFVARSLRFWRVSHLWIHLAKVAWQPAADPVVDARRMKKACSAHWKHLWWRAAGFWWHCRSDDRLQGFLQTALPVGRAMLAGIAAAGHDLARARTARDAFDQADFGRSFVYNEACSEALMAAALAQNVAPAGLGPAADRLRSSFASLRTAVVLGYDAASAGRDSSLDHLAEKEAAGYAALTGGGDLARIKGLEPTAIHALVRHGIQTAKQLTDACSTKEDAAGLARRTGLARKDLLRWARIAHLWLKCRQGPENLAALVEAGIGSVTDLRLADARKLTSALGEAYARLYPLRAAPPLARVKRWIESAPRRDLLDA